MNIKTSAIAMGLLFISSAAFAAGSKPNIVFLMTDDQRWDTLGCYGRTDVITPHIDKLAAQGVAFDNAYYAVAICMPSRATMFTGRYFSDHQAAGYRTGFVGKFGIRLDDLPKTAAEHFDFFAVGGRIWPKEDQEMWVPENWVEGKNMDLPKLLDHCRGTYLHVARTSTPEQYQKTTRRFAVQGYTVDQQVGRLMVKLEEMGVLDNTIVIYTSDNGRFHGSHGLFDKALLYDESVKEPLIVFDGRAPKSQHGRRVDAMVSSVDVAPTILSLAGVDVPEIMRGKDLSGLLTGTQDMSEWRKTVLMENLFIQELHSAGVKKHPDIPGLNDEIMAGNRSYRTRGVRTERYKYFKYYEHDPAIEELYDLKADPSEQNNLISNPEYADVLSDLRQQTEELYTQATATH